MQPIFLIFAVNGLDWQRSLADSSKTVPRVSIYQLPWVQITHKSLITLSATPPNFLYVTIFSQTVCKGCFLLQATRISQETSWYVIQWSVSIRISKENLRKIFLAWCSGSRFKREQFTGNIGFVLTNFWKTYCLKKSSFFLLTPNKECFGFKRVFHWFLKQLSYIKY